ncbi:putative oxidoreductase GLYR1 homolog [Coccinella septempunctata]|uniref:putative oxidoreductase GLYR1 homolog n=1 Tax=Coccinella septempunctata TaxID=41139 RepID=UPI001D087FC0|nr:putative oxidoreductase GLYR1 homolog [Coccinella septempunctata]
MSSKFEVGDLVWAKMKGYPPWPAQVVNPPPKKGSKKNCQWIYFFGSENYAWIEVDQIKSYHAYKEKLSMGSKAGGFKQALEKIEEFIEKKKTDPTYEIEMPAIVEDKDDDETPKKPKKAVKRMSKDAPSGSPSTVAKKPRRSSPKFEENGSLSLNEELAELPASADYSNRDSSPLTDLNSTADTSKEKVQTPSNLAFGFMGLGVMGTGIVKNLINSGHRVNLWNRTIEKCEEIKKKYQSRLVTVYDTPCEVVLNSDVIFSCVSDSSAAGEILYGNLGVLSCDNALEGKGYVEMTGIDPETSMDFCKSIQTKGGFYLEAQLQGSKKEAEESNLVILTAGDHSLFEKCQSCFKAMGKTAFYLGNVGYAAKMNMVLNMINSIAMVGLSEAFSLADRSGLSTKIVLEIFNVTNMASPYLQRKAERIVSRDFQNPDHPLQHMQKDIKLCLDLSNTIKQPLLMASTTNEILKHARRLGYDGQDCSCVFMKSKF